MTTNRLLTITEAADRLGVHYQTLRLWADRGRIPCVRLPSGYRRFEPGAIEDLRRQMGYRDDEAPARRSPGRPPNDSPIVPDPSP